MTPPQQGWTSLTVVAVATSILVTSNPALSFAPVGSSAFRPSKGSRYNVCTEVSTNKCSLLFMSKDSDRARVEKNLEDMMGDDWRVFRAKLVAQEQAEARETQQAKNANKDQQDKQIGNFLAGAISSIFSQKQSKDDSNVHVDAHESDSSEMFYIGGSSVACSDPFATEEELPLMMQPKAQVDKHRWAHPITHIEPGCVLIANEKLGGVFHQTVVLVIDHHENTGSTGIVINRPVGTLLQVASATPSNVDLSLKLAFNSATTSYGGPVMQEDYSVLHGYGEVDGAKKVSPGVFVGGSKELMNEVRRNKFHPSQCLFVKGHAAWVPQQLSREISKGVWYTAAVSADFVLRYAGAPRSADDNSNDLWSDVLTCMGGEYAEIAKRHAGKGDKKMMA